MNIELIKGPLILKITPNENTSTCISVRLTLSEYLIVEKLIDSQGTHISKRELIETGWPHCIVCDNALNMVIMSLRRKLASIDKTIEINTIQRFGYSLNVVQTEDP
ncbi:transcriptional regulator [Vibrio sp. BS-M-Sm-2]|uniref:winged helix-turn-helix domain-containing protein n=1 Tax=Vibrio sp. BS-M-Sm-2 TaxID=3241167 RepID=UPI003556E640